MEWVKDHFKVNGLIMQDNALRKGIDLCFLGKKDVGFY